MNDKIELEDDGSISPLDMLEISNRINDEIEKYSIKTLKDEKRTHLGISEIGKPCSRQLFYKFRWMFEENFDGRMHRLFKRGHREEEKFISYLEGIGCQVYRFDNNGKQFRVTGVFGHYGGSCDAVIITPWIVNYPFLGEFKTHNTKSFSTYVNNINGGGLAKSKPEHFDQMCGYGEKMQLKYGLYFPENKNDDDIQVSIVKLDWKRGEELERKAAEIILAKEPPPKISENPVFFNCKFCAASHICHDGATPLKNCRSCRMASPVQDAQWHCSNFNDIIPKEFIPEGCPQWTPI